MSEELTTKIAGMLHEAGWRSPNDAQWTGLRALLPDLAVELSALRPAAQPVAWGVFRLVDGEWAIQHPVRFTQCAAESDRKAYANPSLVRVHPLYLSTAAVPEGCIDQVRSALGEARKAFLQLAQMQGRSEDFHALMLSHESQMTRALNSLAAPPAAAPAVPVGDGWCKDCGCPLTGQHLCWTPAAPAATKEA